MNYHNNERPEKFIQHIEITKNRISAIDCLAENTPLSRQKIKQAMIKGAVWVTSGKSTNRFRRAKKILAKGQSVHIYYDPDILEQSPLTPELIADEDDYSVWFKPSGMLSQGTKYGDHTTIYRWVETHLRPQRPAFIVHRLDKATSGLIMIAHSKQAAARLSAMFSSREMSKFYKALVHGIPCGELPIIISSKVAGKQAKTQILHIDSYRQNNLSLLDLQILTGRKHQIRYQLAEIGHAVVGDRQYGSGLRDKRDLCLVAYKLLFTSPFDQQKKLYKLDKHYFPSL